MIDYTKLDLEKVKQLYKETKNKEVKIAYEKLYYAIVVMMHKSNHFDELS